MSSLKLSNLSKSYGQAEILKKINLDIVEGEFLVLVGPSGCGKSTTLRLIAGLEEASEGEIFIGDDKVNGLDPAKRDIAMVFQNYALYPHMTVFENMAFGLKLRKFANPDIEKRVTKAAEILMLEEYLQRRPKELSGGQRQRVALGRAIVRQPKVFLFDEPLSNLDAKLRGEMRVEIKKLHCLLGTTMVYVTHDQTEAMTMGDRIAVMNDGIIEQLDHPRELYNHPKNRFVASFIGSPEINLFAGELRQKQSEWVFISNELTIQIEKTHYQYSKLKGENVIFGIRPENIHDSYFSEIKDDKNTIDAKVKFIEYLGSEMNVHLTTRSTDFTARFIRRIDLKLKDSISVIFDVNQGHFFNIENGNIL